MSMTTIPRFLLPRGSAIWRPQSLHPQSSTPRVRTYAAKPRSGKAASKPSSSKPLVLEKPTKFNPPSHGQRLRKDAPRYPGPQLGAEELARQSTKKYPHMMPPDGSFMHWFLHNKSIHIFITLGVLSSLAGFTFLTNFKRTSKFADLLPPASDLFFHPVSFASQSFEVLRLHTAAVGAETQERRQRNVDDVAKRDTYRKAHGINTDGFGGWTAKRDEGSIAPGGAQGSETNAGGVANDADGGLQEHVEQQQPLPKKPLRKWLGIW